MGCTPQLQFGWKAFTIERNSGTPFSEKQSSCCFFILHRHQYLPWTNRTLGSEIIRYHFKTNSSLFRDGLGSWIHSWLCSLFHNVESFLTFPQSFGGNSGKSWQVLFSGVNGQPSFLQTSSSLGQLLVRAFAGDALPDLLKGSPAVGFWGRMLKKRAEEYRSTPSQTSGDDSHFPSMYGTDYWGQTPVWPVGQRIKQDPGLIQCQEVNNKAAIHPWSATSWGKWRMQGGAPHLCLNFKPT